MSACSWPLAGARYERLAHVVPHSYTKWVINSAPEKVLKPVRAELNKLRTQLGLEAVIVEAQNLTKNVKVKKATKASKYTRRKRRPDLMPPRAAYRGGLALGSVRGRVR